MASCTEYGGNVFNSGTAALIRGLILFGVEIKGAVGTVTNYGSIAGIEEGVLLYRGGAVANGAIGFLLAQIKRRFRRATTFYVNKARDGNQLRHDHHDRYGPSEGVRLRGGGSLANLGAAALISGDSAGLLVKYQAASVINQGTIAALAASGIGIEFSATLDNTVTNSGTIAGDGGDGQSNSPAATTFWWSIPGPCSSARSMAKPAPTPWNWPLQPAPARSAGSGRGLGQIRRGHRRC